MPKRRKSRDLRLAIAYMRASTDGQGLSGEAQRALIERWASSEGVSVLNWHMDQGVSGAAPLEKRPALVAATTELHASDAGTLVVAKRDRLARDVLVALTIERIVESFGARLVSADGTANGSEPADKFMRTILDGTAAYERALIRDRTRAALAAKKARGERIGGIPYGYRVASDGKQLEIDAREQQIIARARQLIASGLTYRKTARTLADEGIFNRRGKLFDINQLAIFARTPHAELELACGYGHVHTDVTHEGKLCLLESCKEKKGVDDPLRRVAMREKANATQEMGVSPSSSQPVRTPST